MDYVDELIKFDRRALTDSNVNLETVNYACRTKSSHWSYEREWRIYASLGKDEIYARERGEKYFFVPFSDELELKEVIIGARSEFSTDEIRGALRSSDKVEIITARASFRDYKMVEQQLARKKK